MVDDTARNVEIRAMKEVGRRRSQLPSSFSAVRCLQHMTSRYKVKERRKKREVVLVHQYIKDEGGWQ